MNVIKGTKPSGRQWNRLLDAVVKILKYNNITIDGTASYLTAYNDDVLKTNNNNNI